MHYGDQTTSYPALIQSFVDSVVFHILFSSMAKATVILVSDWLQERLVSAAR